jgi:type IV pilus assembly protein PilE
MKANSDIRQRGFSLLELVIAMAIVAILASIAIPSYRSYVLKSHRTEAKTALLDAAALEERFFSTTNSYTATPSNLGYATAAATPFVVGSSYYQITAINVQAAVVGTPATYTITAQTYGSQTQDTACQTFTISSAGVQSATGTDPNPSVDCWN